MRLELVGAWSPGEGVLTYWRVADAALAVSEAEARGASACHRALLAAVRTRAGSDRVDARYPL